MTTRPDIVLILTDQERAAPPYETDALARWRVSALPGRQWFHDHGVSFERHYCAATACVPSRPSLLTGHYPDLHGVTQTDGLGKRSDDSRMRWLRPGEVPTLGNWMRAGGYDTHYDGKWHVSHADLIDPGTGAPLATNRDDGTVLDDAVAAYLDADPLDAYGFSGWVGPEPHGAPVANSGLVRDPLLADRVVEWLQRRYEGRRAGQPGADRPFLLIVSFVNPHDIVFWPAWANGSPLEPSPLDPPPVPESPTEHDDLSDRPSAQRAYRDAYPTAYGPGPGVVSLYGDNAPAYRSTYYRLMAEVDSHVDRVRRVVTEGGSSDAVLVLSSDHGEMLGSHGGLHQKWFNLYEETVRVPLLVARVGERATDAATVYEMATSHVDVVPTVLAWAGISQAEVARRLRATHSEVHALPGRDLSTVVENVATAERDRPVYVMSRDNILEGDSDLSLIARRLGDADPPDAMRIQVPAHVAASFEAVVARVSSSVDGGLDHLWKLIRTHDDPATWAVPHVRRLADEAAGSESQRYEPLPDEWELYDLDADPVEAENRWGDPRATAVAEHMVAVLSEQRAQAVPTREVAWPYPDLSSSRG